MLCVLEYAMYVLEYEKKNASISFYKDTINVFIQLDKESTHTQKQGWMGRKLYANLTNRDQDPK